ncbi:hypothetical protein HHK36_031734 [Tetracentron sinense]|uniref:Expansin-like EG45 domain-containing protein n=1 Tax=Tetracentron sinense TaxID=13715 RepID=A0A835CYA7_TETSI|nr:hypothetical protein HHK36_031734 [Tetracentron sinense]
MGLLVIAVVLGLLCNCVALVLGDVGTATSYAPPYTPTKCSGNRQDQFPPGNLFVALSEGLWDNGAACGRRYRLRCISGIDKPCKNGDIDVEVVDLCSKKPCPSTFLMSKDAFAAVSRSPGFDVLNAPDFDNSSNSTKCNGYDQDQFPDSGLFVALSNGIWDNGAACGRKYRMRCISGLNHPCKDRSIVVEVVDVCRNNPCPATLILSNKAFDAISRIPNIRVNVEYIQ